MGLLQAIRRVLFWGSVGVKNGGFNNANEILHKKQPIKSPIFEKTETYRA